MKSTFRPSRPSDGPQIAALLREAGLQHDLRLEYLHWKFWQERGDWSGPRSYVIADGERLLAHGAVLPSELLSNGGRVRLILVVDWAARTDAAGAGVSLMKRIGRLADGLIAIGGSVHTRRLLPHIGFRPYGAVTGYARTLHPMRILAHAQKLNWRLAPRIARSFAWHLLAGPVRAEDWSTERVDPEHLQRLTPVLPAATDTVAVMRRSEAQLRYISSCPIVPIESYDVRKREQLRGYFLLARVPGQARLIDCSVDSADPADWCALIQCAVRQAQRCGSAAELVAWASDPLLVQAFEHSGFHARNVQPLQLMLRDAVHRPTAPLRVQMLDADAPYLDFRSPALWA